MTKSAIPVDPEIAALAVYYEHLAKGTPAGQALADAVRQFPTQSALLADAAFAQSAREIDTDVDDRQMQAIANIARRVAAGRRPQAFRSILSAIRAVRMTNKDAAIRLRIGDSILGKLERRTIDFPTIPVPLVEHLADLVGETVDRVSDYLKEPPKMVTTQFVDSGVPGHQNKVSFSAALSTSASINEVDQATIDYWLSQPTMGDAAEGS